MVLGLVSRCRPFLSGLRIDLVDDGLGVAKSHCRVYISCLYLSASNMLQSQRAKAWPFYVTNRIRMNDQLLNAYIV